MGRQRYDAGKAITPRDTRRALLLKTTDPSKDEHLLGLERNSIAFFFTVLNKAMVN